MIGASSQMATGGGGGAGSNTHDGHHGTSRHQQQQQQLNSSSSSAGTQHQHLVNHRTSSANQKHDADDDYTDDNGMRVGTNYQAEVPQFIAFSPAPEYYEDEKAIRVWSPNNKIPEHVLDEFITKAKDKFFYNTEQALGMLSWHKFDLNRAYADLPNFVPYPNEWSVEDKVLFEQAYQFHEKQFNKIKQMLPDKSMANLINYYYSWKKTRTRASLMERQTRRFASRRNADSNNASDDEAEGDDDDDDDEGGRNGDTGGRDSQQASSNGKSGANNGSQLNDRTSFLEQGENASGEQENNGVGGDERRVDEPDASCCVCSKQLRRDGQSLCVIVDGIVDNFCSACFIIWRNNGRKVITQTELGDCFYHPVGEPKRMLFSYQDVLSLVDGSPDSGQLMLKQLDAQVQDAKRDIQTKKQTLSQINDKIQPIANQIADLNIDEFAGILPEYKPAKTWTPDETSLVIQGIRRYGEDFSAISDVIRTKSPDSIRLFYATQKERLNLTSLVKEHKKTASLVTTL